MTRAAALTLAIVLALVLTTGAPPARAQPALSFSPPEWGLAAEEGTLAVSIDPHIAAMLAQVDAALLHTTVGDLSGEWAATIAGQPYTITTRYTGSGEPLQKATEYAGERLQALGLEVEYHTWRAGTPPNVIGELPGLDAAEQALILCGHLDDTSLDTPAEELAPGADDNASGSAGVLAAAAILSQYSWTCDLRFALWTGEEQGLLGSRAYAARASSQGDEILGVVNLDMIAYNSDTLPIVDVHADSRLPETVALANLFAGVVDAYDLGLQPSVLVDNWLRKYSDSWAFVEQGYPAILAIEDYYDSSPEYHTSGDRLSSFDMAYYTEFVRAAVATVTHAGCFPLGVVQGQVRDAWTGMGISGARVTLEDRLSITYTVSSDAVGAFTLEPMAAVYRATVMAPGYRARTVGGIRVPTGGVVTQDFFLVPDGTLVWRVYLPVLTR